MFSRHKNNLIIAVLLFSSFVFGNTVFAEMEELKFISSQADALILVNNNPEDAGFSFITGLWQERFELKSIPEKKEAIDRLYSELPVGRIMGAVFLPEEAFNKDKEPNYPEFIVVIETKGDKAVFEQALNILITKRKQLKTIEYEGYKIIYRDKKLEPFHGEKDLAAYMQTGDFFVIAMNPEQLKQAVDIYKGRQNSIADDARFIDLYKKAEEADAFIFLNNETGKFSNNLQRWEEKEGMRLLLSSGLVDALGLYLDLETDDALKGKVIFVPKAGEKLITIEDDALFFAEVITRSFAREGIHWISDVESSVDSVKLEFEGTGFKPIWENALLNKRIAFLEDEQKKEEISEEQSALPAQSCVNNLPKVIFVITMSLLALAFFLWIKRKRT